MPSTRSPPPYGTLCSQAPVPRILRIWLIVCAVAPAACGDDDTTDAGPVDARPAEDTGVAGLVAAPMLPVLTPCPEGWREVAEGDVPTCDPWPPEGPLDCGPGQAHLPGTPGCEAIGAACPADGLPAGLPSDAMIVYVVEGATDGDGSAARPYGTLSEVDFGGLAAASVVAVGPGTYEGTVQLPAGVSLWGACAAQTVLQSSTSSFVHPGVVSVSGSGAELRDVTLGESVAVGVRVEGAGNTLHLEGVVVDRVRGNGVRASDGGALTGNRVAIRDTQATTTPDGIGLWVSDGGSAEMSGLSVERSGTVGVVAQGFVQVRLSDVVSRDNVPRASDGVGGEGVWSMASADVEIRRGSILRGQRLGVATVDVASRLRLEDTVISDTVAGPLAAVETSRAIFVDVRSRIELSRVLLARNIGGGMFAAFADVQVEDLVVRDAEVRPADGAWGRGISLHGEGEATLRRVLVERTREVGVNVSDGSPTLEDLVVRDTRTNEQGGGGRGLNVQDGGDTTLRRARVEGSHDAGLLTFGPSRVTAEDVAVVDTGGCDPCPAIVAPVGVAPIMGGAIDLRRFEIHNAETCGIMVAAGGELDLLDGEISNSEIGACVQVEGYDLGRLDDNVRFVDNGVNLDSTDLPVPQPVTGS